MSNNKQIMKLYTEEQVKDMLFGHGNFEDITPIELPSDEEIKKTMTDFDEFDPYDLAYLGGAIRMRNLIQGGNK